MTTEDFILYFNKKSRQSLVNTMSFVDTIVNPFIPFDEGDLRKLTLTEVSDGVIMEHGKDLPYQAAQYFNRWHHLVSSTGLESVKSRYQGVRSRPNLSNKPKNIYARALAKARRDNVMDQVAPRWYELLVDEPILRQISSVYAADLRRNL